MPPSAPPGTRAEYQDLRLRFPDVKYVPLVLYKDLDRYYTFDAGALAMKNFQDGVFYQNSKGEAGFYFDRWLWPSVSGYLLHWGFEPIFSNRL